MTAKPCSASDKKVVTRRTLRMNDMMLAHDVNQAQQTRCGISFVIVDVSS